MPSVSPCRRVAVSPFFLAFRLFPLLFLCFPAIAFAHPMGNFSINHFAAIAVSPSSVRLTYIIDMAEIPTFQEMQEHQLVAQPDHPSAIAYKAQKAAALQHGLSVQFDTQELPLTLHSSELSFPPGASALPTLRLVAVYEAPLQSASGRLQYQDRNYPNRMGWKEIIATAHDGVTLTASSVPAASTSVALTVYATDLLQAPLQQLQATLSFARAASAPAPAPAASALSGTASPVVTSTRTPRNLLTELMGTRQLSLGMMLFALLTAVGLGAFHALEPGHGKTLVAAYLVGSQGTAWHAFLLGLIVTASHTVGVYALGGVALYASHYVVPEQLYPWLGLASGVLITGTGLFLLARAWRQRTVGLFHHHHDHDHAHAHDHDHAHSHHHHQQTHGPVSYGALLTLGITGGMIPCPAALVVLLSAVALHRIGFGLLLIVAFSVGLAIMLIGTGMLLVSVRGVVQRWQGEGPWLAYLPFVSPLVITPLGVAIIVRSLAEAGIGW